MLTIAYLLVCGLGQDPVPMVAPVPTGFVAKTLELDGEVHRYVVYVPAGYGADRQWPLLVFLHGRGESGTDNQRQLEVGLGPAIRADPARWPFVVACPQKTTAASSWTEHEALVLAVAAAAERDYRIDPARRFLTGLSQGGHGAWTIGARHADRWAAIAPICGFRRGDLPIDQLRDVPVWAFHGRADPVVPADQSVELCAALAAAGGAPLLTLYDGVGHNSWDRAYRSEALSEWLLAAPAERRLVYYLADAVRVQTARLRWQGDGGEPRASWELDGDGLYWQWEHGAERRQGRLPRATGAAFALARLRGLRAAGWFAAAVAAPAAGAPLAATVEAAVDGAGGPWHVLRCLPTSGAQHEGLESLRRSLAAEGEVMAELAAR